MLNPNEGDLIALAEELGDEIVPIAGEGGGGLRRYSNDGNTLMSVAPFWPAEKIIFMPNYTLYQFIFVQLIQRPSMDVIGREDAVRHSKGVRFQRFRGLSVCGRGHYFPDTAGVWHLSAE